MVNDFVKKIIYNLFILLFISQVIFYLIFKEIIATTLFFFKQYYVRLDFFFQHLNLYKLNFVNKKLRKNF